MAWARTVTCRRGGDVRGQHRPVLRAAGQLLAVVGDRGHRVGGVEVGGGRVPAVGGLEGGVGGRAGVTGQLPHVVTRPDHRVGGRQHVVEEAGRKRLVVGRAEIDGGGVVVDLPLDIVHHRLGGDACRSGWPGCRRPWHTAHPASRRRWSCHRARAWWRNRLAPHVTACGGLVAADAGPAGLTSVAVKAISPIKPPSAAALAEPKSATYGSLLVPLSFLVARATLSAESGSLAVSPVEQRRGRLLTGGGCGWRLGGGGGLGSCDPLRAWARRPLAAVACGRLARREALADGRLSAGFRREAPAAGRPAAGFRRERRPRPRRPAGWDAVWVGGARRPLRGAGCQPTERRRPRPGHAHSASRDQSLRASVLSG